MVLDYAEGKDLDYWVKKNHKGFDWLIKIKALSGIIQGLNEIHQKQIVHHDFHTGNILASITTLNLHSNSIYISDMGLCGEAGITDRDGKVLSLGPEDSVLGPSPQIFKSDFLDQWKTSSK
jgi:serine/threonine protein kinase